MFDDTDKGDHDYVVDDTPRCLLPMVILMMKNIIGMIITDVMNNITLKGLDTFDFGF